MVLVMTEPQHRRAPIKSNEQNIRIYPHDHAEVWMFDFETRSRRWSRAGIGPRAAASPGLARRAGAYRRRCPKSSARQPGAVRGRCARGCARAATPPDRAVRRQEPGPPPERRTQLQARPARLSWRLCAYRAPRQLAPAAGRGRVLARAASSSCRAEFLETAPPRAPRRLRPSPSSRRIHQTVVAGRAPGATRNGPAR